MNHQDWFSKLREIRIDLHLIHSSIRHYAQGGIPDSIEASDALTNSQIWVKESRNSLREVLEIGDTSGCYPDPPTDTPSDPLPLSSGPGFLEKELEEIEDLLKELLSVTAEYYLEGWAVRYHEDSVVTLTKAKHEIRLYNKLQNEESSSGEKERVQSSSNRLQSTDRSISISGRAGQH